MDLAANSAVATLSFPPPENFGFEFLPVNKQLLKDENVVDHERLKRIKEKVEKAASAAEKASRNFQKLYSTLRDLSTVSNDKNATWDAVVQKYIAEEGKSIHAKMSIVNNSLIPPPPTHQPHDTPATNQNKNHHVQEPRLEFITAKVNNLDNTIDTRRASTRRKKPKKSRDPNRPKKPPNAFMMFLVEQCDEMKNKSGTGGLHAPHVGKIVSERWKELPHDQKRLYEERYQISKKKYEEDIKIYYANREEDPVESPEIIEEKSPVKIKQEENEYDFASTAATAHSSPSPKRLKRNNKARPSSSTSQDINNKDVLTQNTGHRSIQQTPIMKIRKNSRKPRKVKDANRPKKPANPYALYLAEQCSLMKQKAAPGALNAPHIGRVVSERWRSLSKEDKQVYMDRYNIAKNNYDEEVRNYNSSLLLLNMSTASTNLTPPPPPKPLPPKPSQEEPFDSSDEHDELEGAPLSNDEQEHEHDELQDDYDVPLTSPKSSSKENQEKVLPVAADDDDESTDESLELEEMQDVEYSNGGEKDNSESFVKTTKITADGEHLRTREALMVNTEITKKKHMRKHESDGEEDSIGDESDHSPLGTPSADGEISPSKWSLKGLFSGFKRPKFFQ
ncbi:14472_t:CDS:2 [Ambispora leptoticha]|uniref:14472_t:CDS:1 n=1 Tax=Ambispora leptoticha TaxID=144679 RepID=A0A9N8VRL0_9GLOM|nr:14472_t:CDS:2 [Ambispora leptoticha]